MTRGIKRLSVAAVVGVLGCSGGAGSSDEANKDLAAPATSFERPPYVAVVKIGDQSLALIGAHSKPEAAVAEANSLDDVWSWVSESRGVDNGVILGDLNLACDYASADDIAGLDLRKDARFKWLIPDTADTNVAESQCAYDRIIVVGDAFAAVGEGAPSSTVPAFSDHIPIGFDFNGVKIGAFNPKVLGDAKVAESGALDEIAGVVCSYDLTLVQEIVADSTAPADALLARVNETCGPGFQMTVSEEVGTTSYKERFAFLFRTEKVSLTEALLFPQETAEAAAPEPAPAPDPAPEVAAPSNPSPELPAECGTSPYVTPGGYCYATKEGKKKRVADSCCGI